MSHSHSSNQPPVIRFLFENSIFLVAGAVLALVWANVDHQSYENFIHFEISRLWTADHAEPEHGSGHEAAHESSHAEDSHAADEHASGDAKEEHGHEAGHAGHEAGHAHNITIHFIINDVLMALFFAMAAMEVWESMLPGGALSNLRKAATPLLATLGGIVGPAGLYLVGAWLFKEQLLIRGWAIPCATDIAFSYLVARWIFGVGHPAIAFLLLLAIADDAAGLAILAVAYPQQPLQYVWFLLTLLAIAIGFGMRKMRLKSFWWYLLIPGVLSWISFYFAGIHAALGLVPIIPAMPHAHTDLGIFARDEMKQTDTLNAFAAWWKNPVELILGLFGLANAGVMFASAATGTGLVLAGLVIGKPLGITFFTWIAQRVFGLEVPKGITYRHIVSLGLVAGIGFTVALFVSDAAYADSSRPDDVLQADWSFVRDSVKMGALLSFFAGAIAIGGARLLGIKPISPGDSSAPAESSDSSDSSEPSASGDDPGSAAE